MRIVLNAASYSVERKPVGAYDAAGQYTPGGPPATIPIIANVQPYDGRTLESEPFGDRVADIRIVFTNNELRPNDRVSVDGEWYVIETVETRRAFPPVHYECIALRQTKGA